MTDIPDKAAPLTRRAALERVAEAASHLIDRSDFWDADFTTIGRAIPGEYDNLRAALAGRSGHEGASNPTGAS